ncbi:unnamed protein product, partial [Effrenium voratum]
RSFSALRALSAGLCGRLAPAALGVADLRQSCEAAVWAWEEQTCLRGVKAIEGEGWSGNMVTQVVLEKLKEALKQCRLQQLQLVSSGAPLCVVPTLAGRAQVPGNAVLAAACLLATDNSESRQKAGELLRAVASSSAKLTLWPPEQRVRWLSVAAAVDASDEAVALILENLASIPKQLALCSPVLAELLPRVAANGLHAEAEAAGRALCDALVPELYRLRLPESQRLLAGCLELRAVLGQNGDALEASYGPSCEALLKAVVEA